MSDAGPLTLAEIEDLYENFRWEFPPFLRKTTEDWLGTLVDAEKNMQMLKISNEHDGGEASVAIDPDEYVYNMIMLYGTQTVREQSYNCARKNDPVLVKAIKAWRQPDLERFATRQKARAGAVFSDHDWDSYWCLKRPRRRRRCIPLDFFSRFAHYTDTHTQAIRADWDDAMKQIIADDESTAPLTDGPGGPKRSWLVACEKLQINADELQLILDDDVFGKIIIKFADAFTGTQFGCGPTWTQKVWKAATTTTDRLHLAGMARTRLPEHSTEDLQLVLICALYHTFIHGVASPAFIGPGRIPEERVAIDGLVMLCKAVKYSLSRPDDPRTAVLRLRASLEGASLLLEEEEDEDVLMTEEQDDVDIQANTSQGHRDVEVLAQGVVSVDFSRSEAVLP